MSDQAHTELHTAIVTFCLIVGIFCCLLCIYNAWVTRNVSQKPLRTFAGIAVLMCFYLSLTMSILAIMERNVDFKYGSLSFFACQIVYLMASLVYRAMVMSRLGRIFSADCSIDRLSTFLVVASISVNATFTVTYCVLFHPLSTQTAIAHARFWYASCGFTMLCEVVDGFCIIFVTIIRPSLELAKFETTPSTSLPQGRIRRTLFGRIAGLGLIGASATRMHIAGEAQSDVWDTGASALFLLMTVVELSCAMLSCSTQIWIDLMARIVRKVCVGDAAELVPPPAYVTNVRSHVGTRSNKPIRSDSRESILGGADAAI